MADQLLIRDWLKALGRLTVRAISQADADEFLDTIAPLLATRFTDQMFTAASLEHVAAECRFLPTYGEIVALLRDFRHAPALAARPAINDNLSELNPIERYWLNYWQRREAEGFAPLREPDGSLSRPDVTDWREHTAGLMRQHAETAWNYLCAREAAA